MTTTEQRLAPPPSPRWRTALLVLGLLAGLLAMHALAPGGAVHGHGGPSHPSTAVAVAADTVDDGCAGHGGDCGGGHARHADATCAAAAVSGTPAPPLLVPDALAVPARAESVRSCASGAPDGARAPPSLAELQLLRI
ncbi:DUF6153 family protein [Streptomyces asoensis]|uniref:DUF6153 family protein n=1 Tax=Streptomyces asoensis TaxID=249586 RepID=UPI0037950F0A